jgi:hypothetical protein
MEVFLGRRIKITSPDLAVPLNTVSPCLFVSAKPVPGDSHFCGLNELVDLVFKVLHGAGVLHD